MGKLKMYVFFKFPVGIDVNFIRILFEINAEMNNSFSPVFRNRLFE
jgi:hypothetical protein